jgi:hypothetical protein
MTLRNTFRDASGLHAWPKELRITISGARF